jgi:hypothetical protein
MGKSKSKGKKVETCIRCGSEWLYKGPGGMGMLCEDCYKVMHAGVIQYHDLQDQAEHEVRNGRVNAAVTLLKRVIELRNSIAAEFFGFNHKGHHYYANVFLPALIDSIVNAAKYARDPYQAWKIMFIQLEEEDRQ